MNPASSMTAQRTMTDYQMALLAQIFRIIVKEIKSDEDKNLLAPGEIGVSYTEGCFYVKNPTTGELFCPNSVAHISQITSKFDPDTKLLNSDMVNGIHLYSSISQLTQLGVSLSMDSIIRQMEEPAILTSLVEYENYETMGFPSNSGIVTVFKSSPEAVLCQYYDNHSMITYTGRYNTQQNLFVGWTSLSPSSYYAETTSSGSSISCVISGSLADLDVLCLYATADIDENATLRVNGASEKPLVDVNGDSWGYPILANNIIMLIYDEQNESFVVCDAASSTVMQVMKLVCQRLNAANTRLEWAIQDYQQRFTDMANTIEQMEERLNTTISNAVRLLKARPGLIDARMSTQTIATDSTDTINRVEDFDPNFDKLIVIFGQTILQPTTDFVIEEEGSLVFQKIRFNAGDILQFIVFKQGDPES